LSTDHSTNDVIYQRPDDFDLEHEQDDRDVVFYQQLLGRLKPARVLDLACGSGRVPIPLAHVPAEQPLDIVGVDVEEQMLAHARQKCADLDDRVRRRLTFTLGDMRAWRSEEPFDLVMITCSSITHLLTLDDRVTAWRRAFDHLRPGGRFVVDVTMPNLRAFAESLQTPPRALLEVDTDATDPQTGRRLVRYKATTFDAFEQRATIKFFYDRFDGGDHDRYLSDFASHVYFPDELRLLFVHTGFAVEAVWGDFSFRRPRSWSREIVMMGRRP